jgi:hypothetical protein
MNTLSQSLSSDIGGIREVLKISLGLVAKQTVQLNEYKSELDELKKRVASLESQGALPFPPLHPCPFLHLAFLSVLAVLCMCFGCHVAL